MWKGHVICKHCDAGERVWLVRLLLCVCVSKTTVCKLHQEHVQRVSCLARQCRGLHNALHCRLINTLRHLCFLLMFL